MKKVSAVVFAVFFLALIVTTKSSATDYSWVLAGSQGYLSSTSNVATFFYGKSGTSVAIFGSPSSQSLKGYCGMAAIGAPTTFLVTGYTTSYSTATLSNNDLYLVACVKV